MTTRVSEISRDKHSRQIKELAVCKLSVCVLAPGFMHVQYIGTLTQIATDSPNIFGFFFLIANDLH